MSDNNDDAPLVFDDDPNEPPFEVWELERANALRHVAIIGSIRRGRGVEPDPCPHTPMCADEATCIEEVAWYLRHQKEIENGELVPRSR